MTSELSVLETEKVNPATMEIDRMSAVEMVEVMNAEDAKVAEAVRRVLPEVAMTIEAIAARMGRGGRLIYMGAGTSGRLGALDASECPPTFNLAPDRVVARVAGGPIALSEANEDAEDSFQAGYSEARGIDITPDDVLVAIAASGRTPYALGAVAYAKEKGAMTVGIACNVATPLEREVAIMIAPVVGPEVITGSTRLKAGTAQKMVLNMISTGTMIMLGKTYGNLMVDVQPTNEKLQRRARKIVQLATGLNEERAAMLLEVVNGEVKTAIVVARTAMAPEQAREQLAAHRYVLRETLDAL